MFISEIGKNGRTVYSRILPNSELIAEIIEICKKYDIKNGYISTCIGSLKNGNFVYAISDEGTYFNMRYSKPYVLDGPIEFLAGQGVISMDVTGKYMVHLHALMSDEKRNIFGGHILNEGNIVLATIDIVINELIDMNLVRKYHKESGFHFFTPMANKGEL